MLGARNPHAPSSAQTQARRSAPASPASPVSPALPSWTLSVPAHPAVPLRAHSFGRLTLHVPATWHVVPVEFINGGIDGLLGYLTSQTPLPECRQRNPGQISCGPPIAELEPNSVLITIVTSPASQWEATNAVIASQPAIVTTSLDWCQGMAESSELNAGLEHRTGAIPPAQPVASFLNVVACFRGPAMATLRAEVDQMLATATYH